MIKFSEIPYFMRWLTYTSFFRYGYEGALVSVNIIRLDALERRVLLFCIANQINEIHEHGGCSLLGGFDFPFRISHHLASCYFLHFAMENKFKILNAWK